uniref:Uncharacterized protein n=1 Tax=Andalucia godoyi TaxID=505711 RepID=M4Q9B8_ANDGO|nr:hypothetical protein L069_p020 [Andalucia godoyi]AGH24012.1 hypothetical protein [Andalucia godoyi]
MMLKKEFVLWMMFLIISHDLPLFADTTTSGEQIQSTLEAISQNKFIMTGLGLFLLGGVTKYFATSLWDGFTSKISETWCWFTGANRVTLEDLQMALLQMREEHICQTERLIQAFGRLSHDHIVGNLHLAKLIKALSDRSNLFVAESVMANHSQFMQSTNLQIQTLLRLGVDITKVDALHIPDAEELRSVQWAKNFKMNPDGLEDMRIDPETTLWIKKLASITHNNLDAVESIVNNIVLMP